jgi:formylglycine-generating enzyme required for sulfatase activity
VYTAPVGKFAENDFGLNDVLGNVWEWVQDCWHANYEGAPTDGSVWWVSGNCEYRVFRGGSWYDVPGYVRSAHRNWVEPDDQYYLFFISFTLYKV